MNEYVKTLQEEYAALKNLIVRQEELRQGVFGGNWDAADTCLVEIDKLAQNIEQIESYRNECHVEICKALGCSQLFSEFYNKLGEVDKKRINTLYREIKVAVLQFKCCSQQIEMYLKEIRLTAEENMEKYFPELKNKRYGSKGEYATSRYQALVFDCST